MSVYVTGYTEARVNGKWHGIDFYQYDSRGKLSIVPCVTGQSMVLQAIEWDCDAESVMGAPDDLSDGVRETCSDEKGILYGSGNYGYCRWYIVEGSWFDKVNLSMPEYCGFFPRQDVCRYLSNPDENEIDTEDMLSIEEYQNLDAEIKKAYQYFEYTEPYGSRSILRGFKQAVMDRVWAYNRGLSWEDRDLNITLSDVRVLILVE